MEKLINSIPKEHQYTQENGEIIHQGFNLRWRPSRNKWQCGYGAGKFSANSLNVSFVEADDPVEAVAFFVELISKK